MLQASSPLEEDREGTWVMSGEGGGGKRVWLGGEGGRYTPILCIRDTKSIGYLHGSGGSESSRVMCHMMLSCSGMCEELEVLMAKLFNRHIPDK